MPASVWASARGSPATAHRSSQAAARAPVSRAARSPGSERPRGEHREANTVTGTAHACPPPLWESAEKRQHARLTLGSSGVVGGGDSRAGRPHPLSPGPGSRGRGGARSGAGGVTSPPGCYGNGRGPTYAVRVTGGASGGLLPLSLVFADSGFLLGNSGCCVEPPLASKSGGRPPACAAVG